MDYDHDRRTQRLDEPSLAAMTPAAIRVLRENRKGDVPMVEGGRIDHNLLASDAYRALDETRAFSDAVQTAVALAGRCGLPRRVRTERHLSPDHAAGAGVATGAVPQELLRSRRRVAAFADE